MRSARDAVLTAVLLLAVTAVAVVLAVSPGRADVPGGSIVLSRSHGLSGAVVMVAGRSFPPSVRGRLTGGLARAVVVRTDEHGAFTAAVTTAGDPGAVLTVTAVVRSSHASARLTVDPSPWRSGDAVGLGTTGSASLRDVAGLPPTGPDLEGVYGALAHPPSAAELTQRYATGSTLLLTLEPYDVADGGTDQGDYRLARIVDGAWDPQLTGWARAVAGQPVTPLVRFAHEMNGDWYPWSERVNGNRRGEYVSAYRHVVDLFRREGASARWVWSPNVVAPGMQGLEELYPGDGYVDVVGIDGYNWGAARPGTPWRAPADLFDETLATVRHVAVGKPVMIAETASAEAGGDKARWIAQLFAWARAQPDLQAVVWFDEDKETDWRTNSSPGAERAFAEHAPSLASRRGP